MPKTTIDSQHTLGFWLRSWLGLNQPHSHAGHARSGNETRLVLPLLPVSHTAPLTHPGCKRRRKRRGVTLASLGPNEEKRKKKLKTQLTITPRTACHAGESWRRTTYSRQTGGHTKKGTTKEGEGEGGGSCQDCVTVLMARLPECAC